MSKPRYYFNEGNTKADLDFTNLGFDYFPCPYRFEAIYEYGVWRARGLVENNQLELPEGSQCVHYGQQLFEGMKANTGKDGNVYAFRPYENAKRMAEGARYLQGAAVPEELFVLGIEEAIAANLPFVPPYGSGAAMYMRPFWMGIDDNIGVKPARKYLYRVFVCPVGPYFKGGFGKDVGQQFMVGAYDRAAPLGTGHIKAGGNYASSFKPGCEAKAAGFAEALYLDPTNRRYIEEIGAANFLGFKGDTLITPDSHTVLPSITRDSLMFLAHKMFDWPTECRKIPLEELAELDAAACCGTAAVITWIKRIVDGTQEWTFEFDERWQKLYDTLIGIQNGDLEDPFHWRHEIPT
ncbi:MAG: branched-chain amino acid aminotransferase [bacterium]|nr:branched-chain amino acid aminotransferase [bacterium]